MADTINQVRNEGYKTREQLEKAFKDSASRVQNLLTENKNIEKLIEQKMKAMENRHIIEQNMQIYKYAKAHPEDKAVANEYSSQISIYKAAVKESFETPDTLPTTKQLLQDIDELSAQKEAIVDKLDQSRQEQQKLYQYKKIYDTYLGKEVER